MTCESYEALIALHVEGDLPAGDAAGVEAHLAGCASCRGFAEALRDSQRALKDLGQEDVDAAALAVVRQRVGAALDGAREARPARRLTPLWTLAAAAGVAILAIILQRPDRGGAPESPGVPEGPVAPLSAPASAAPPVASPSSAPRGASPVVAAVPRPAVRAPRAAKGPGPRAGSRPAARPVEPELPMVIKLVTSDPDVVIYWLMDKNGGKS